MMHAFASVLCRRVAPLAVFALAAAPVWAQDAIPVTVQPAATADVPVYASGLGTVAALATALVRARVDGTLDQVLFTEGQEVPAGAPIAQIDPRPYLAVLAQAQAKRAQDAASLGNARTDLARLGPLARSGYATRQSADTQAATVQGGAAQIAADDAAINAAALNVAYTRLTAPIAGRVGLRQIDPGNMIHATDTTGIVTITQLRPIGVLFTLPEQILPQLADSQQGGAHPQVQALASDTGRVLATGQLLTADNAVDTTTGTIRLKATFANTDGRLWPGAFVAARLLLRTLHGVVTVPARAVQRGQDGLFVFVMDASNTARQRPVQEYLEQDGIAAIRTGLAAGERVVTDGQSRVSDGAMLRAEPPPAGS